MQREEASGEGARLANCESRNALIPVPVWGGRLVGRDGVAVSHLPGCCPLLPHRMGSLLPVLGWTTPKPIVYQAWHPGASSDLISRSLQTRGFPSRCKTWLLCRWLCQRRCPVSPGQRVLCWSCCFSQPGSNVSQKDFLKINNSRPRVEDFSPGWVGCTDPVS